MKRADSLVPLSREHHFALRIARQLNGCAQAPAGWLAAHGASVRLALHNYWRSGLAPHFRAEENSLPWSLLDAAWERRLRCEHREIEALLARACAGDDPVPEVLRSLSQRLAAHVRWEEQCVFPALERCAPGLALLHEEARADPLWTLPRPPSGDLREGDTG